MDSIERRIALILCSAFFICATPALSQDEIVATVPFLNPEFTGVTIFDDLNGNGVFDIDAFGDSITRGQGDFVGIGSFIEDSPIPSGEGGYPLRIETLLGINVSNLGVPGERAADDGVERFARTIPARRPDLVVISEGANDARDFTNPELVFRSLQTMVNIAQASGVQPVVATISETCCDREFLNGPIRAINNRIRTIGTSNNIGLADVSRAYDNTCIRNSCELLNQPEGLHPNSEGYDVTGETIIAALLGINIFDPLGPAELEFALNLPEGSVRTKPDAIVVVD